MRYLYLFIIVGSIFTSCEEVGPLINLSNDNQPSDLLDTSYVAASVEAPQQKAVLIEEFTGVKCSNCPQGHTLTSNLSSSNPGRVITVSMHSQFLADPYSFSVQDLRRDEADDIVGLFGIPGGKPIGMIDRNIFPSESEIWYFTAKWSGLVNDQIANATTPVNLSLEKVYNPVNRQLNVTLTIHYTREVTTANKYTILLTENEIVTAQLMPSLDIDTFYVHEEVFRNFITPVAGTVITANRQAGRTIIKELQTTLDPELNADHVEVVAFVHETGNSQAVYHAVKIDVKN